MVYLASFKIAPGKLILIRAFGAFLYGVTLCHVRMSFLLTTVSSDLLRSRALPQSSWSRRRMHPAISQG